MRYLIALTILGAWALAGCAGTECNTKYPLYIKEHSHKWQMTDAQRLALDTATDAELLAQGVEVDE